MSGRVQTNIQVGLCFYKVRSLETAATVKHLLMVSLSPASQYSRPWGTPPQVGWTEWLLKTRPWQKWGGLGKERDFFGEELMSLVKSQGGCEAARRQISPRWAWHDCACCPLTVVPAMWVPWARGTSQRHSSGLLWDFWPSESEIINICGFWLLSLVVICYTAIYITNIIAFCLYQLCFILLLVKLRFAYY